MALSTAARDVSRGAKAFSLVSELASVVVGRGQQSVEGGSPCDAAAPPPAKGKLVVLTLCHVLWAASLLLAQNGVRWPFCTCATNGPPGTDTALQPGAWRGGSGGSWSTAERLLLNAVPFLKLAHPMVWVQLSSSAAALVLLLVFSARRQKRRHPQQQQPPPQRGQGDQQQHHKSSEPVASVPAQQQQQQRQQQGGVPAAATAPASPPPQVAGPVYAAVWPLVVAQLLPVATTLAAYGDFSQQLQHQPMAPGAHPLCASSGQHVLLLATPFLLLVLLASQAWCLQLPVKVQLLTSCLQSLGLAAVTSLFIQRWGVQVLKSWLVSSTGAWLLPLLHTSQVLPWLLRWWQQRRQGCGSHTCLPNQNQQQQQQQCKLDQADKATNESPFGADGVTIGVGDQGGDMLQLLQPLASSSSSSSSKGMRRRSGDGSFQQHPALPTQQQQEERQQQQQQGAGIQAASTTAARHAAGLGVTPAPALPRLAAAADPIAGVAVATSGVQLYMPPQPRPLSWLSSQPSLQPPHTITVAAPDAGTAIQGVLAAVRAVTQTSRSVAPAGVPGAVPAAARAGAGAASAVTGAASAAAGGGVDLVPRSSSLYSSLYKSSVIHLLLCIRVGSSTGGAALAGGLDASSPAGQGGAAAAAAGPDGHMQGLRAGGTEAAGGAPQQPARLAATPVSPAQRDGRPPPSPQLPLCSKPAAPALTPQQQQLVAQLRAALEGAAGLPRLLSLHELQVPGWGDLMLTAAFAPAPV